VRPDVAVFGKKDYQQWRLIETMAHDLNLRVRIVGGETVREPDGLALSSRNRYLSATERKTATRLSAGLYAARQLTAAGERRPQALLDAFRLTALKDPGIELEYIELRRRKDLEPFAAQVDAPAVMLVAARVGTTRLIDNLELD
jgi:pantoate--beta-alanine ligase